MNTLEERSTVYCNTYEERFELLEKLVNNGFIVGDASWRDRYDVSDYNLFPCVTYRQSPNKITVSSGRVMTDPRYSVLLMSRFFEKAGIHNKTQGDSKLIHKFI